MQDAISVTLHHIFSQKYNLENPLETFRNSMVANMFHEYKKGDVIIQQGSVLKYFYFLLSGQAIITNAKSNEKGNSFYALMPLDILGLPTYLDGKERHPSNIIARTSCVVFLIPQKTFISLITSDPVLCYSTLRILGQIYSNNLRKQEINSIFQPRKRLGYYLYLVAQDTSPYICQYTREELADLLVINQRSLYRYLSTLEEEGCLELKKGKITIDRKHYEELSKKYGELSDDF